MKTENMLHFKTTYAELLQKLAGNTPKLEHPSRVTDQVYVKTPTGTFAPIVSVIEKSLQPIVRITTEAGRTFECSKKHLFQAPDGSSVVAWDATTIQTTTGPDKVVSREVVAHETTFDIEIPAPHWYVSPNGIIHHNTFFALSIIKQWLKDNPTGSAVYFDTESATTNQMLVSQGIDLNRFVKIEPETIEQFRQTAMMLADRYSETPEKNRPPMLMVLDSLGNMSSAKEIQDVKDLKDTKDMTKPGLLKGTFRVLRLRLAKLGIPLIVNNHVYAVIGCLTADSRVRLQSNECKNINNIVIGDVVKTLDGYSEVTDLFKYDVDETFTITLEDGTTITATPNHKFLTTQNVWKRADELSEADELAVRV